jgi:molybdenum cofactor biosynthesis enzyme
VVDPATVQALVKLVPISEVKLCAKTGDPDRSQVPPRLNAAIGSVRPITTDEWERLTSLDRYMLNGLSSNPRLLWRALQELAKVNGHPLSDRGRAPWARVEASVSSEIARAEIRLGHETVVALMGLEYLDGRAFVLARAAGRRVARAVPAIFDLHADDEIGPIELDWAYQGPGKSLVWQAHVSKGDGSFAAAASLSAATAAAVCLVDMVRERDPAASIVLVKVLEEPWSVGQANEDEDSSTAIFRGGAGNNIARLVEAHRKQAAAAKAGSGGEAPAPSASAARTDGTIDSVSESIRQSGLDPSAVPHGVSGNTASLALPLMPAPAAAASQQAFGGGGAPSTAALDRQALAEAHKKSMQDPTQLVSRKTANALVASAGQGLPAGSPLAPAAQPAPFDMQVSEETPPIRVSVGLLLVGGVALVALLAGLAFLLLR